MLPTIQIKDDFFTKKEFNILSNNLNKLKFECFVQDNGITSGFYHPFEENKNNKWLYNKVKKNFFPNQNLKIKDSSFRYRHNSNKILAHTDYERDYNFICYLKGEEIVYNGTGFYYKNNLNTYIGFVENRAIFFDGKNNWHTDLQGLGESSPRYSINIFYNYG